MSQKLFSFALCSAQAFNTKSARRGSALVAPTSSGVIDLLMLEVPSNPGLHHIGSTRTLMCLNLGLLLKVK